MRTIRLTLALVVTGVALSAGGALAQPGGSVEVGASRAAPPLDFRLERAMPLDERVIREQEFYPGPVRSRHEPAFVIPFVTDVVTSAPTPRSPGSVVRIGLSAWTAPAVPFDIPQATGGAAFGLTVTWGGPPRPAPEPAAEAAPSR
jgi:hypothetical protein